MCILVNGDYNSAIADESGWIHIKTDEPGAGLNNRKDRIRDCVTGDRVNKRASPDWSNQAKNELQLTMA